MSVADAYSTLYTLTLCVLGILVFLSFIRAIRGPRIADRIVAINMIGTQVIVIICVLALMLDQGYLADVALLYAMISFLTVVLLCKVYLGVYLERKAKQSQEGKTHA